MKAQIVTIIGNVAAGKSSAMEIVTSALNGVPVNADDLFQTADPFREVFLEDQSRWALANEMWLTVMRGRILRESMKKNKNQLLVVDSGLLMSWVYTHSHFLAGKITKNEWELFKDIFCDLVGDLLVNMEVIYLDYSMDTLLYRLKKRGRDYELKYYTRKYLAQLELGFRALIKDLVSQEVKIVKVSEREVPEFVKDENGAQKFAVLIKKHFKE